MATKLKGLEVGKVDFVDEGANQRADAVAIRLVLSPDYFHE